MLAAALVFLLVSSAAWSQTYTVLRIPVGPNGGTATGYAIANDGTIVGGFGWVDNHEEYQHAFVFKNGTMTDMAAGGCRSVSQSGVFAAGWTSSTDPVVSDQAFLSANSVVTNLFATVTGAWYSIAYGTNDAGTVVGSYETETSSPYSTAFSYSNGTFRSLGFLPGDVSSVASGINNSGTIVGTSRSDSYLARAFSWSNGAMTGLGTVSGAMGAVANAINAAGTIVGSSYNRSGTNQHALRWSGGQVIDLGTLDGTESEAWGINGAGVIVGDASTSHGPQAFIFTGGAMVNLNAILGAGSPFMDTAYGISDSGQIVACDSENAYLLTPVSPPPNQVITLDDIAPNGTYEYNMSTFNGVTLYAVASSGLQPTFTILGGPATLSGNTLKITGAGVVTIQASQAGGGGYNAATPVVKSLTVQKGNPVISWAPAWIAWGSPLGSAQLNASASVAGTFTYSPAAGTLLPMGNQTLTATFVPADTADFNPVTVTASCFVAAAIPTITWPAPAPIILGTPLSSVQLNATANVPGAFSYQPGAGDMLPPGYSTLFATFYPTDNVHYLNANANITIQVINQVSFYVSGGTLPSVMAVTASGYGRSIVTDQSLSGANGLVMDGSGNVYVSDGDANSISRIRPDGTFSTIVANGLVDPVGIAMDGSGNLFVANFGNNTISEIAPDGRVTTFVKTGLSGPAGLAFDRQGNLYEADTGSGSVQKITTGGRVSTFASGMDGPAGLAFDSAGSLYVSDLGTGAIYRVDPGGGVSTFASGFNEPIGLACDAYDNVYEVDTGTGRIMEITPSGSVSVLAASLPASAPEFIVPVPTAPVLTASPSSVAVGSGQPAALTAAAVGEPAPAYEWSLGGSPIAGATDPILLLNPAVPGSYTCTVSNLAGSVTTAPCSVSVVAGASPGYLANLSARSSVGESGNLLIGGFVIQAGGDKALLLRAVGPGLADTFGLTGDLARPQLTLFDPAGLSIVDDTGWGNAPVAGSSPVPASARAATADTMSRLGAFALKAGSLDSAMAVDLQPGSYTVQVGGADQGSGIGLVEIYDADSGTPLSRLVNISARTNVGSGGSILIGGLVVAGPTPVTVLIRGVGPGLADRFGLTGILGQPTLQVFDSKGNLVCANSGWKGDSTVAAAAIAVGAFALNPAHADAALLVTLPVGAYTAQMSGANGTSGIGLMEIYGIP